MEKRIIAFTGKMFSGKSTAIEAVRSKYDFIGEGVENIKFAQPLYDIQAYIYQRIGKDVPQPKDRKLLQWLGTDWGRAIDLNLWVKVWSDEVAMSLASVVTCDDCRFDNEAATVKEMGGIIIRIVSPEERRKAQGAALGLTIVDHASEAGISDQFVDYEIHNTGTKEELEQMVLSVVEGTSVQDGTLSSGAM